MCSQITMQFLSIFLLATLRPAFKRIDFRHLHTAWGPKITELKFLAKSLSWFFSLSYLLCLLFIPADSDLGGLLSYLSLCSDNKRKQAEVSEKLNPYSATELQSILKNALIYVWLCRFIFLKTARKTCLHHLVKVGVGLEYHLPYGHN